MGREKETCNPAAAEYQLSRWRSIHTLIASCDFKDLFAIYGTKEVQKWVDEGNIDRLRCWVRTIKHGSLAEKTVEELRCLASRCQIKYYGKLSKAQLLAAIIRSDPNAC